MFYCFQTDLIGAGVCSTPGTIHRIRSSPTHHHRTSRDNGCTTRNSAVRIGHPAVYCRECNHGVAVRWWPSQCRTIPPQLLHGVWCRRRWCITREVRSSCLRALKLVSAAATSYICRRRSYAVSEISQFCVGKLYQSKLFLTSVSLKVNSCYLLGSLI